VIFWVQGSDVRHHKSVAGTPAGSTTPAQS
jgi:hypothetical protein